MYVTPRRIAFVVDELPETAEEQLVKGPPAERREQAAAGFAKRYGLAESDLEERDGHLWARVPGEPLRGEPLLERMRAIAHGFQFAKSMRWDVSGLRFARPVRWFCEKLDAETLAGHGTTYGHRFTHGELEIASADAYADTLRGANVEPDAAERRRQIVEALDGLGDWQDPLGKLDEVVFMVEWPLVFGSEFDERFLRLPERVIVTAMQSHQRYFPLGENRFAVVAAGGEVDVIRPGYTQVLDARLEDAAFTFDRDVAVGIDELAGRLDRITFFEGGGTFADKTARLVELAGQLGGDDDARAGCAGSQRLTRPPSSCASFPSWKESSAPSTRGSPVTQTPCAARSRSTTCPMERMRRSPRPTRAACCRRRTRSTRSPSRSRWATGPRDRATRTACDGRPSVSADSPWKAGSSSRTTCSRPKFASSWKSGSRATSTFPSSSSALRVVARPLTSAPWPISPAFSQGGTWQPSTRCTRGRPASSATRSTMAPLDEALLVEPAERSLAEAVRGQPGPDAGHEAVYEWAVGLAPVVGQFFDDVLVMDPDEQLRTNRLRLVRDVRDAVGRLGDLSEIPL